MSKPTVCPNPECKCHSEPVEKFYIKKGYYTTKHNHQPVPRYKCKTCGKYFSSHTFSDIYKQKKPELNEIVYKEYCSNVSLNRLAKNFKVNRKTIVRKFLFMAQKARNIHDNLLKTGKIEAHYVQFDEMETYEHTKMKPLSIALAVEMYWDEKGKIRVGRIIDAVVATMNCKGWLAEKSRELYGEREDTRYYAGTEVLESIKLACKNGKIKIGTDGKRAYPNMFKETLPQVDVFICSRKNKGSDYDPLFVLNHTCARIRHDLSRMARKSWVTTQKGDRLQAHLDLFIAYYNEYELSNNVFK